MKLSLSKNIADANVMFQKHLFDHLELNISFPRYNGKVASRPDLGGRSEGVGDMAWPLSSPYFAMGLVLVIVLIFGLAVFTR